jgi:hypothetical protein
MARRIMDRRFIAERCWSRSLTPIITLWFTRVPGSIERARSEAGVLKTSTLDVVVNAGDLYL